MKPPAFECQIKCHLPHHPSHFITQENHSLKVHLKSLKSWTVTQVVFLLHPRNLAGRSSSLSHSAVGCSSGSLPAASRHTHTHTHVQGLCCQAPEQEGTQEVQAATTVRHCSAEPGSSPLKFASWKCLEIAIKKKSMHIYTVARHVPPESASRAYFLLVTNWVILYEFTELF